MNQICHPKYKSSQYRHYMFDRDQSIIDKQKSRYEKQQQKRIEMHEISKKVGIRVFHKTCFGVINIFKYNIIIITVCKRIYRISIVLYLFLHA